MSLVDRVKGVLLTPQKEWPVIEAESTSTAALYTGYIMPLAAIPALASLIGFSVIGISVLGTSFRIPIGTSLTRVAVQYVLTLVGVFIMALIVDALAPTFGGTKSQTQALKLMAYSSTASWVAGIFLLIPSLGILALLGGLYSLYLLFLGVPVMMKAPADKSLGYTIAAIVCAIVVFAVVGIVTSRIGGYPGLY
jgi:hypothetical protein